MPLTLNRRVLTVLLLWWVSCCVGCGLVTKPPVVVPPPAPVAHLENLTVTDVAGTPIPSAAAMLMPDELVVGQMGLYRATSDAAGRLGFLVEPTSIGGGTLTVGADGYVPVERRWTFCPESCEQPPVVLQTLASPETIIANAETLAPLPALPICPSCPSPYSYDQEWPWPNGAPHDRDFIRADAWGVDVPGLPFVTGGSSEHPERLLTGFLYKYDRDLWPQIFKVYAAHGYTHWVLWIDALEAEDALTLDDFVAMCREIKRHGFYVQVGLNSKVYEPRDQTFEQWKARLEPLLDRLIAEKVIDEGAVWEWDSYNEPGQTTIDTFKWIGQKLHAAGVSFWIHFLPEHTSWFADGDPRGRYGFYADLGDDVDGLQYQSDPGWDIGELQARLVDTLIQFARQGNHHKLRLFETTASTQFTHDKPTEAEANLYNYLGLSTKGPAPLWGSGNGVRLPSGASIH